MLFWKKTPFWDFTYIDFLNKLVISIIFYTMFSSVIYKKEQQHLNSASGNNNEWLLTDLMIICYLVIFNIASVTRINPLE